MTRQPTVRSARAAHSFVVVLVVLVVLVGTSLGCGRSERLVSWTIDGSPAAEACALFAEPAVRLQVHHRDGQGGAPFERISTAVCSDGETTIAAPPFAEVAAFLVEEGREPGTYGSGAVSVDASSEGDFDGLVALDITLTGGKLEAPLTVQGAACDDAGAESIDVRLSRRTGPLATTLIVEDVVSCKDGVAAFRFGPVDIGSRYALFAATDIDGARYATPEPGVAVLATRGLATREVDLQLQEAP